MVLDERKMHILQMVIDDYIMTAAPVGSRTISKRSDLKLSSATIRNEMSDLEEMGYLDSPHTSAGRVPSEKAYRLYVDSLMKRAKLTCQELSEIKQHLNKRMHEASEVINQTAKVLSELTNYTAIVMTPQLGAVSIDHVTLIPAVTGRAVALIVTDNGIVYDTIINVPHSVNAYELEKLSRMLTITLKDSTILEAPALLINKAENEFAEHRQFLDNIIFSLIQDAKKNVSQSVVLGGATNLLAHPEYADVSKARHMLEALESKDELYKILAKATNMEFSITIGTENELEQMRDSSIVTATYRLGNKAVGSFGVIGPTRMNYAKVVSILNTLSQSLSEALSTVLCDGEDKEQE